MLSLEVKVVVKKKIKFLCLYCLKNFTEYKTLLRLFVQKI